MILLPLLAAAAAAASPSNPPLAPLARGWNAQSAGTVGIDFALPAGGSRGLGTGSTVGLTYFLSDGFAVRADFGLDAVLSPSGTPALFEIGLALRSYRTRRDQVALFLEPSLRFGRELTAATNAAEFVALGGAFGAEYFFTEHLAAGGQLGLALRFGNIGGPTGSSVVTQLTTRTSQLFATIYF